MDQPQNQPTAIIVDKVSKNFVLPHERARSVKQMFTSWRRSQSKSELQRALKNINFEVQKGEFLGIVGRNGSGKSTLLKLLAGIYQPTQGQIQVSGKLVPFIELGVGFNPELTGRENVYLNGALLGFSKREVSAMYQDIVSFAELERFMDQKLKNYSSGMQVRLAFSLAIRAKADILLIDEVLAVGDADFQRKCFDYFRELKKSKTTVVFVSHDMNAIIEYCDRAILVDRSELVDMGKPETIAKQYNQLFIEHVESDDNEPESKEKKRKRWGDQMAVVQSCRTDQKTYEADKAPEIKVEVEIVAKQAIDHNISIGFMIKNASGNSIVGSNTYEQHQKITGLAAGQKLHVGWRVPNIFGDGKYYIDAAVTSSDGSINHDWREEITSFRVYRDEYSPYIVTPTMPLEIK